MNAKISPQQVLELLQTDGTFDKWKKQITDEFEKSEAEKVKNETRNHVFNSKTLASVTQFIHPKSSAAASIYKDVQDEIMRSGFSDRIHSQVRRILQIEPDGDTNNNNNDTNESPFTTNLTQAVKANVESTITKLQEPKTPKDIPSPPFQPAQPTAKLKPVTQIPLAIKQEPKLELSSIKKELPFKKSVPAMNGKHFTPDRPIKKLSVQDPTPKPLLPKDFPPKTPSTAPTTPTTPAPPTPTVALPLSTNTPPTKVSAVVPKAAKHMKTAESSSSSESSDTDTSSSSSNSESTSDSTSSSDSDSDTSSSPSDTDSSKDVKKMPPVTDIKQAHNAPIEVGGLQDKPVSAKKSSEKRKRNPKRREKTPDNNTEEGSTLKEKKSRRGRLIKPSSWILDDDSPSIPLAKRRKKKRQQDVSGENPADNTEDTEVTSIRKKYYRRHKDQEAQQKQLQATLEGKRVMCQAKKGAITATLITCDCCSQSFNFSSFQDHAGCESGNPWDNIRVDDAEQQTLQYFYDQVEGTYSKKISRKHFIQESQSSQLDTQSSQVDIQPTTPPTPKALSARRKKKRNLVDSQDSAPAGHTTVEELRQRMTGILTEQELEDLIHMADPHQSDEALCGELISQLQKKSEGKSSTEVAT